MKISEQIERLRDAVEITDKAFMREAADTLEALNEAYQACAMALVLSDSSAEGIIVDRRLWEKAMTLIESMPDED